MASDPFNLMQRLLLVLLVAMAIAQPAAGQEKAASEFACLIQPKMVLKLGTSVPSLISEVLVDRGAIVKKGDVVARLDSSVEQAALTLAEARAANDSAVRSGRAKPTTIFGLGWQVSRANLQSAARSA
jgi:multidrug efflux pump subunit AcrA (membrane-fusion protein)